MVNMIIDGKEVSVDPGMTVLQACEQIGIEIPRFCYHERLSVAGNCRMCLVQMEKSPKPIASCAMPVGEGMTIHTNTPEVEAMRKSVMEFLLLNHPLDCPICDQGGECDLQDQSIAYGIDHSRYQERKRSVTDKHMGPLISTTMTRCIHCTRCVRFATEIAGVPDLGLLGRGENAEITTYLEKALNSELSGNVIDLCPVGALTSKPYAFIARPWELKSIETIDVMDAIGSNIRVDVRGAEVLRVLPILNEDINEEWISDKTRFACDALSYQRLDRPYIRKNGRLKEATWNEAFNTIAATLKKVNGPDIAALAGDLADCESMIALKMLIQNLGSENIDCRQDCARLDPTVRSSYLFNSALAGIDQTDAILLIGCNPRWEAAVLNARIRKRYLESGIPIGVIGEKSDLNYEIMHLGDDVNVLHDILAKKGRFSKILRSASRPMIIIGQGALARGDGHAILGLTRKITELYKIVDNNRGWNGFNMLHTAASRVGGLDLGFVPGPNCRDTEAILDGASQGSIKLVYLLGADEINMERLGNAFVIYQGHHGDTGANRADVILPGAAYTEKNATYVNTEGRVQRAYQAVFPPGEAKEDWRIIRALSEIIGKKLEFDSLAQVRAALVEANPNFLNVGTMSPAAWNKFGIDGEITDMTLSSHIKNFYMTDPISRASITMANCSKAFANNHFEKITNNG
ncbi:MAG: NADH-quinone oxidoreductase subunit G [Magnetovibrio sp.]|nr:NADH-quinone oxidoreductase subunit G [Magnetovibrio sp.]